MHAKVPSRAVLPVEFLSYLQKTMHLEMDDEQFPTHVISSISLSNRNAAPTENEKKKMALLKMFTGSKIAN